MYLTRIVLEVKPSILCLSRLMKSVSLSPTTMERKEDEMSRTEGENSTSQGEPKMSAASDVMEMKGFCGEIADLLRLPDDLKTRTNEVRRLFGRDAFSWNRINEFLRGKAHRVDGWEKDHARAVLAKLRAAEEARKDAEHIAWLARSLAHLEASDPDFYRPEISALERALGVKSAGDGPVAVPGPAEADADQSNGRGI